MNRSPHPISRFSSLLYQLTLSEAKLRLIRSDGGLQVQDDQQGRLQLWHQNKWVWVCGGGDLDGDGGGQVGRYKHTAAKVACKMLGYLDGAFFDADNIYGAAKGAAALPKNYFCSGKEKSLSDCPFRPWKEAKGGPGEALGVYCYRKVRAPSAREGEVKE